MEAGRGFLKRYCAAVMLVTAMLAGCARSPKDKAASFLRSGKQHLQEKDFPRAVLQFKNAAQAEPTNAEPYYQMALAYLAAGDLRSTVLNLRKATQLNPKHAPAQLKLAELMTTSRTKEVLADAQARLQEVLKSSPDNVDALDSLALAELRLGRPEEAEEHLKQALQRFPANLKSSAALAGLRLRQGDTKGAEEILKKASTAAPQSADAQFALAEFYQRVGRPADAERQLRAALKLDPKNGMALLGIAGVQESEGRLEEAEETLRQVSALPDAQYKPLHALFLYQHGKKDAAIQEFERLTRENPKDRTLRTRLVVAYMEAGRTGDAERTITAALKNHPSDSQALIQRSEIYLRAGKFRDAQDDLIQVLRLRPDFGAGHYLLARVHLARGAGQQAKQELGEAVRLNPNLLVARLELARELLAGKGAQAALSLLNEAPLAQQKTASFIVQRNWALSAMGNRAELRKGIEAGLAIGRSPDLLLQDGLLKLEERNFTAAQKSLQEGRTRDPEDLRLVDALAQSYSAQKQPGKALEVVRQYAAQRPGSRAAQALLGNWLLKNGDRSEARKAFDAAKAADPGYAATDLALAQFDIEEGRLDAARQRLTPLLTWGADNLWAQTWGLSAHMLMGDIEEMSGNHAKAAEHYRRVVDLNPTNVAALNNLAYILAEYLNQADEALKYAQQAKEIDPKSPAVADTIGWVFYRKGIYGTAVQHLETTVSANSPAMKYHLAMAYLKAGYSKRGQEVLQQALRQAPNLPEARMARDVLNEALRAGR